MEVCYDNTKSGSKPLSIRRDCCHRPLTTLCSSLSHYQYFSSLRWSPVSFTRVIPMTTSTFKEGPGRLLRLTRQKTRIRPSPHSRFRHRPNGTQMLIQRFASGAPRKKECSFCFNLSGGKRPRRFRRCVPQRLRSRRPKIQPVWRADFPFRSPGCRLRLW